MTLSTPKIKNRRNSLIALEKLAKPFSNPQKKIKNSELAESLEPLKEKIEEINSIDIEIELLKKDYSEDETLEYIDLLHQYNELKDAGQILLGKMAEIKETTTKQLYKEYGLCLDD